MPEGRVDKTMNYKTEAQWHEAMLRMRPVPGSWSLTERKAATADVTASGPLALLPPALCGLWPFGQSLVFPVSTGGMVNIGADIKKVSSSTSLTHTCPMAVNPLAEI